MGFFMPISLMASSFKIKRAVSVGAPVNDAPCTSFILKKGYQVLIHYYRVYDQVVFWILTIPLYIPQAKALEPHNILVRTGYRQNARLFVIIRLLLRHNV